MIGLLATMPVFGERTVPWPTKAGMTMLLAFLLLPSARVMGPVPANSLPVFGLLLGREFIVGAVIGFLARLLFGAFQFAVNAIDFQMGLSFMQVVNPGINSSASVLSQFLNTLMMLLFLESDGHHILLRALGKSVAIVPLGTAWPSPKMLYAVLDMFAYFVTVSFQLALPTVIVLLLVDLAMGIVGRVIPQLNVFMVAMPVKIMLGLSTVSLCLPALSSLLRAIGRSRGTR